MMKAYVLINVRPGGVREVVRDLHRVVLNASDINQMGNIIASDIQSIPGVLETLTCLAVEET
jgi:hypothetical protein